MSKIHLEVLPSGGLICHEHCPSWYRCVQHKHLCEHQDGVTPIWERFSYFLAGAKVSCHTKEHNGGMPFSYGPWTTEAAVIGAR